MKLLLLLLFLSLSSFAQTQLPEAPGAVGSYLPYKISGKLVYINQISLSHGKVIYPGKIITDISIEEAKLATKQATLNVLAVLKNAASGDLSNIKQVVQLSGFFNTEPDFTEHAQIMNTASDLMIEFFGENGKHARATMGTNSLPLNSPVEIQAIFELK